MRVGIYARVSTEAQEARGTIGSQLEALRATVAAAGDELVAEFVDDGCSGARRASSCDPMVPLASWASVDTRA